MFSLNTLYVWVEALICLLILQTSPAWSCTGLRIPRHFTTFEDDCIYDEPPKVAKTPKFDDRNRLQIIWFECYNYISSLKPGYIACGCIAGVSAVLIADILDYYFVRGCRHRNAPLLCQLVSIIYWLICVIFAPFLYWPELMGPVCRDGASGFCNIGYNIPFQRDKKRCSVSRGLNIPPDIMVTRKQSPTTSCSTSPTNTTRRSSPVTISRCTSPIATSRCASPTPFATGSTTPTTASHSTSPASTPRAKKHSKTNRSKSPISVPHVVKPSVISCSTSPSPTPRVIYPSKTTRSTSPILLKKQKEKFAQTSGPSNKKFVKQVREYEKTMTGCRHERIARLKKTARMLQQFRTKWKVYIDDLDYKNKLIDDALAECIRLEKQIVFLHDACASLREQLNSQQAVNNTVLKRYHDMHKHVLSYLGQTDQRQPDQQYRRFYSTGV